MGRGKHSLYLVMGITLLLGVFQNCTSYHSQENIQSSLGSDGIERNESWLESIGLQGSLLPPAKPTAASIRMLTGREIEGSLNDVLGLSSSLSITISGGFKGFQSGQDLVLDNNLFDQVYAYVEARSRDYVTQKIETDFACLKTRPEVADCQLQVVTELAKKAYRGRVTQDQIDALLATYRRVRPGGAELGRTTLLTALLMSPSFLYRTEGVDLREDSDSSQLMSDLEIAEFISFSLASRPPSEEVVDKALSGQFSKEFAQQWVEQLLKSDRGRENLVKFFKSWLLLDQLDQMALQPQTFSKLTSPEQGRALALEFALNVENLVFEKGKFEDLFSSTEGFVNRQTASLYGLTSNSTEFQKVAFNPQQRKGLLTMASVMATHSAEGDASQDRPIPRGLMVKERLLCGEIGLPSGLDINEAASNVDLTAVDFTQMTVRDRLDTIMQQESSCVSCHAQFMPYGYLMSHYGGLGQWQETQNGQRIDAEVEQVFLEDREQGFKNFVEFADALAKSQEARRCFVEHYASAFLGRALGDSKPHLVGRGALELKASEDQLIAFIQKFVTASEMYLRTRGESL